VTTLAIATVLHATMLAAGAETYAAARRTMDESNVPMVVMVGAEWCGPCQRMKRTILPQLRQRGVLNRVAFAQVDADGEAELARKLTGGGPVPQLVMVRKTPLGWMRRKLIGAQSVEAVERFIEEGLAVHERENGQSRGDSASAPSPPPEAAPTAARPVSSP
jgi:thioredoxin-like negative regulator of GroEL